MNTKMTIGLTMLAATSAAMAGPVIDLQPGEYFGDLSGITNSQMSELIGSVEFDSLQSISVPAGEGSDAGMLYEASLMTRVVRSNETGNLTFNFRIMEANAALAGQVSHIAISGFAGQQTRVEYRGEEGFGEQGPLTAERSADGDTLTYDFGTDFATDESSRFFFAMLDVASFDFEGAQPVATIYLESGEAVSLDIQPPVPAPGALALLGTAGLCMARRRR
jgi:hypothetical protein